MNAVTYLSQNTHYISKLSHYFGLSHKPIAFPHMFPTRKEADREQSTRSNAPTARLPILVRLVETLTRTRLTEHKRATRNGDANNHIAVPHQRTNHNIDWDSAQCLTYSIPANFF